MFEIKILEKPITILELKQVAGTGFGDMVKAVVDVENGLVAIGAELHVDMGGLLVREKESLSKNVWGINLYPEKTGEEFLEFDSMVNLKPGIGNRSRNVENIETQQKIREIIANFILK